MTERIEDYSLNKRIRQQSSLQQIGIVGCGIVGQEIARMAARYGMDVIFLDMDEDKVKEIFHLIGSQLDEEINHFGLTEGDKRSILSRIKGTSRYEDLGTCQIVHESVNSRLPGSNLELCREIFKKIEAHVSPECVIATNNSSLMVSEIALQLENQERAIGIHFLSPANKVKVVEIARGVNTNIKTLELAKKYLKMLGKDTITINESPGHISTRLIVTLINESCELLMEGVGTVDSIDKLMKQGYGLQQGPFEMADRLGLDKVLKWMDNLYNEYSLQKFKASPIIKRLVRSKYWGKQTGKGFYNYENGKIVAPLVFMTEFKF